VKVHGVMSKAEKIGLFKTVNSLFELTVLNRYREENARMGRALFNG
jgi:hypothetical protein